jgi:hypothetical protein
MQTNKNVAGGGLNTASKIQQTKVGILKDIGLNENHRLFRFKETSTNALGFGMYCSLLSTCLLCI